MITNDAQIGATTANEIRALLTLYAQAQQLSDLEALAEILTDDFELVGPLGFVVEKEQWLEQLWSGALRIEALQWDEVDVRTYADAGFAIAIGRLTQTATYAGSRADGAFRVTAIAVGRGLSWRLAGLHFSRIVDPNRPAEPAARA
jgi:ketosteroid isomerase-like protein